MLSDHQVQKKIEILSNKLNLGNYNEVINEASILIKKNKHQVLFNILSLAYQSTGELKKSETIMDEALKLNPNNPYFLNNMGITQHKLGNYILAEKYFLRGLKIVPNYINILNNIGNLKKDLDQTSEALNYYKKSLSINPKVIQTLLNISICYQSLGNFDKAKNYLESLLKVDSKFTTADRLISSMTKYTEGNNHLDTMKNKSNQLSLNSFQQANLFFALGKAHEDLKQYEQSFKNYSQGNYLLKKIIKFKIEDEKEEFEKIKKIYLNFSLRINLKNSRKIIFIVGMPRSSTSLVEQILSSHKSVYGGGELIFLKKIINTKFLDEINYNAKGVINNVENLFQEVHNEYIENISQINNTSEVFTDKTPLNFKYIGFIKKIFPNSKIINCKRNSLDVCWSNFKNFFGESLPFTNDLNDLGNYYNLYEDLMKFWEDKFPKQIYHMNYDQLIENSENEIKKMLNFCELDWDPNCMKHEQNTKTIKTASASQAREPINKTGLKNSEPFKNHLSDLLNILND